MKFHSLSIFFIGLLLSGTAHAQFIQGQNYLMTGGEVAIPQTSTPWTQLVQIPSFDTTLGALNQVRLEYTGEIWQSVGAENQNAVSSTYDLNSSITFALGKQGGPSLLNTTSITLAQSGSLAAFDQTIDFAGASGVAFDQHLSTGVFYSDPMLTDYLGSGSISFFVSATGAATLIAPANVATFQSSSAAGNFRVLYGFTAIPEPSTYAAILGVVTLGFVTIRRRQVRSQA